MQQQEPPDPPTPDDLPDLEWAAPLPPELGPREWLTLIFERFGFWIACAVTVLVIVFVYLNADQESQKEETPDPATAGEQAASIEALETTALAGVPLTITTEPVSAALFVDGEYVGVSPLRDLTLTEGRHLISVLKPTYGSIDTVVTLSETSASLQFTLHNTETSLPDEDLTAANVVQQTVADNADQIDPEQTTPALAPVEVPAETDQAALEEEPVATDEVAADEDEDPVVQVGALQVTSEPSGASVLVAGREVGVTPVLLSAMPVGPQQITLRLGGYEAFVTTVDVVAQQPRTLNGQLKPRLGTLKILVKPWGDIYINGVLHKKESTIWHVATLSPGSHRVRVEHPSLGTWERVVEVAAGEEQALTIDLNKDDSGAR